MGRKEINLLVLQVTKHDWKLKEIMIPKNSQGQLKHAKKYYKILLKTKTISKVMFQIQRAVERLENLESSITKYM